MKKGLFVALLSLVMFGSVLAQEEKSGLDKSEINGSYESTAVWYDGSPVLVNGVPVAVKMSFEDGEFKMTIGDQTLSGQYKLDNSKDPAWITMKYGDDASNPLQGQTVRGLYKLKDDVLIIVVNIQGRPKDFSAKKTSLDTKYLLKKIEDTPSKK